MKQFALAIVAAAALATVAPQPAQASVPSMIGTEPVPSLAPIIKQATQSVVNISTSGHVKVQQSPLMSDPFFRQFFGFGQMQPAERRFEALGSGVIVNAEKGYILTNYHVIAHADKITVTLDDGRVFNNVKVVGKDPSTDLAVIQIKADNLNQIPLGDSSQLQVGDFVIAIGNPFALSHTATSGIVSGLGRSLPRGNGPEEEQAQYQNFIQTDASINPGNSGGALVNLRGQLVGINTAILSRSGGNIGIGFAIPINMAKTVMNQLIKYGKVEHGKLGVYFQPLTPALAKSFNVSANHGAVVTKVIPGSAADKAGIKQGDVLVAVNGKPIKNPDVLPSMIGLMRPGTTVELKLIRNGKPIEVKAKLQSGEATPNGGTANEKLGAKFSNITKDSPLYGQVQGVLVTDVDPDGEAFAAGLRPGMVILAVNRHPVKNLAQFRNALSQFKGTLLLTVRQGQSVFFTTIR
ncbi:MAG TPA: DegQ family serine endoprotease [Gammaproteobacteria bacterium]|nr:DegQ family serine endoprotease [Gammaproteobacteria bacterium]